MDAPTPSSVIDLSDLGKSLVAIEAEIKMCKANINYHNASIAEYSNKLKTLQRVAEVLLNDYLQGIHK